MSSISTPAAAQACALCRSSSSASVPRHSSRLAQAISPEMSCGLGRAAASERGGTRMVDRGRREGQGLGGGDADPVRSLDRLAVHTSSASSAWTCCGCEVRPAPATSSSGRPLGAAETAAPDPLVQVGEPAAGSRVVEGRQQAVHGQQPRFMRPAPACAPRSSASTPWRSSPPASPVPPALARPIARLHPCRSGRSGGAGQ